jgi:hypothetical protein
MTKCTDEGTQNPNPAGIIFSVPCAAVSVMTQVVLDSHCGNSGPSAPPTHRETSHDVVQDLLADAAIRLWDSKPRD